MTPRPPPILIHTLRRSFGSTPKVSRDVMAKYRYRPPLPPLIPAPSWPRDSIGRGSKSTGEVYETSSTSPAGSSIQEVPPPGSSEKVEGVRRAVALPAMVPIQDVPEAVVKEEDREMVVQGVVIPAKPRPPHEEECCMSGCVHCVYNIYTDDLETYTEAISAAHKALLAAKVPKGEWPKAIRRLEDDGERGKEGIKSEEVGKAGDGMDPVMAGFLAMEKRLKKKQLASKGSTA